MCCEMSCKLFLIFQLGLICWSLDLRNIPRISLFDIYYHLTFFFSLLFKYATELVNNFNRLFFLLSKVTERIKGRLMKENVSQKRHKVMHRMKMFLFIGSLIIQSTSWKVCIVFTLIFGWNTWPYGENSVIVHFLVLLIDGQNSWTLVWVRNITIKPTNLS